MGEKKGQNCGFVGRGWPLGWCGIGGAPGRAGWWGCPSGRGVLLSDPRKWGVQPPAGKPGLTPFPLSTFKKHLEKHRVDRGRVLGLEVKAAGWRPPPSPTAGRGVPLALRKAPVDRVTGFWTLLTRASQPTTVPSFPRFRRREEPAGSWQRLLCIPRQKENNTAAPYNVWVPKIVKFRRTEMELCDAIGWPSWGDGKYR